MKRKQSDNNLFLVLGISFWAFCFEGTLLFILSILPRFLPLRELAYGYTEFYIILAICIVFSLLFILIFLPYKSWLTDSK